MEKISVTISVPALGGKFDFVIPENMKVKDVIDLVMRILNVEFGVQQKETDLLLFDKKDARLLLSDQTLGQLRIKDGANLVLL